MKAETDLNFPAFSPSHKMKLKYDDNIIRNRSRYVGQMKPSQHFSLWRFIIKLITMCIILLAIIVCYLSQLDPAGQQHCIQEIKSKMFYVRERSIKILNAVVDSPFSTSAQISAGKKLLKNHDPAGAESMCTVATEQSPLDIDAWTCLGDARLSLHNSAWESGLMENKDCFAFEKLHSARETFEKAVNLNNGAMNPEARLGRGLTLFLIASRRDSTCENSNNESTSQLLFDSILHLNAASSLTRSSVPLRDGESHRERMIIHVVATYNTGLAYLALGDTSSAASLMRQTSLSIKKTGFEGVIIPDLNLMATLVQKGSKKEAISMFNKTASKFCKHDQNYEYESYKDGNKAVKACIIAKNNLAVAKEANGDLFHDIYEEAVVFERELHVQDGFVSLNYEQPNRIQRLLEKDHSDLYAMEATIPEKTEALANGRATPTSNYSSTAYNPILSLEDAARKDPNQRNLRNSMSKAKLKSGNRRGAIEAGTAAITFARTMEQAHAANHVSGEALTNRPQSSVPSSDLAHLYSYTKGIEARVLRQEMEIFILKLKTLQKSSFDESGHKSQTQNMAHSQADNISVRAASTWSIKDEARKKETKIEISHAEYNTNFISLTNKYSDGKDDHVHENEAGLSAESDDNWNQDNGNVFAQITIDDVHEEEKVPVSELFGEEGKDVNGRHANITNGTAVIKGQASHNKSNIEKEEVIESPLQNPIELQLSVETVLIHKDTTQTESSDVKNEILEIGDAVISLNNSLVNDEVEDSEGNRTRTHENTEATNILGDKQSEEIVDEINLPELYNPTQVEVEDICSIAKSYMKMADAYLQKHNFKLASKQFLKVLKKAPLHIPASLGYASSLERFASPKQLGDVVLAYLNASKHALMQGNTNLAQASFQRALSISREVVQGKLEILKTLSTIAFTSSTAAEIQYEIGMEILNQSTIDPQQKSDAVAAFKIANQYSMKDIDDENGFHPKSLLQLGKIALDLEDNAERSLSLLESALSVELGGLTVEALVISARSKYKLGEIEGSITDYKKAILQQNPTSEFTAKAHFNLSLVMMEQKMNQPDIEKHMEIALNLGMDLTPEAIDILGEHHIAVMKSSHRAEYRHYQEALQNSEPRGGIMNGSSVSSNKSIFSSQANIDDSLQQSPDSETLSVLQQGAASYDGSSVPMGGEEVEGDSMLFAPSNQSRAKANA